MHSPASEGRQAVSEVAGLWYHSVIINYYQVNKAQEAKLMSAKDSEKILKAAFLMPFLLVVPGLVLIFKKMWRGLLFLVALSLVVAYLLYSMRSEFDVEVWVLAFFIVQAFSFSIVFGREALKSEC